MLIPVRIQAQVFEHLQVLFHWLIQCRQVIANHQRARSGHEDHALRDSQSMIFMAGASALMVGNYLTTLNQPVEKDLQMLKDLGLDPNWDKHGFSDQDNSPDNVPAQLPIGADILA